MDGAVLHDGWWEGTDNNLVQQRPRELSDPVVNYWFGTPRTGASGDPWGHDDQVTSGGTESVS